MTMASSLPQRLYLMQVASLLVPPAAIPIPCYLVQTGDGKHILIDTGIPQDMVFPPGSPDIEHGRNVLQQLELIGLRPDDIDMLICTHFDFDHTGYHSSFPNAEMVVQRRQYEAARSRIPQYDMNRFHWAHPDVRYRLIDGDTELLPGLKLIETSGHTIGHQSVSIRLPKTGWVLLTIDAVLRQSSFTPHREEDPADEDPAKALASTIKLIDLAEKEPVGLVIYGHDGEQWPRLKKLPDYYD